MDNLLANFIEELLTKEWQIIFLGVLYILSLESKSIYSYFKNKDKKFLLGLLKRIGYLLGGIALVYFASSITNFVFDTFISNSKVLKSFANNNIVFNGLQSKHIYITSVIFFIISGFCLILSAGGRFMVNLTKVFLAIGVLYPIIFTMIILSTKS